MPPRAGELTSEYEAVVTCGYCKEKTNISDDACREIAEEKKEIFDSCPCGHKSYLTSMKAKFSIDPTMWKFGHGSYIDNRETQ